MSAPPKVFIAGIGVLPFGKHPARSVASLAAAAALLALRDAGVGPREIGMAIFANVLAPRLFGDSTLGQNVFASLGMNRIPVVNVENACTSGSTAFHLGCLAIRAGECDMVLAVGAEKMCLPQMGLLSSGNSDVDTLLGLVTPPALRCARAGTCRSSAPRRRRWRWWR
ncbi:MAG: beta-ketoacyl synthase N-terminal-like domain-containing protein [Proteobacteria bacterium]|nr:beta-ketoacyl synthase N-terminal-like domain-containing protein [Pseudomonadota bacterium]